MVISSIDLKGGRVVQLKNGKTAVLERDDADALIREFNTYGEVAVIDLDASLGNVNAKGDSVNTPVLKRLLRQGNVRAGGGIRSVKRAKELISLGAEKVIIGSAAWKKDAHDVSSALDTDFLDALVKSIGRQRIIISVDSINAKIAVKGWTETTDIPLLDGAVQAEKYCSELLFTCVAESSALSLRTVSSGRLIQRATCSMLKPSARKLLALSRFAFSTPVNIPLCSPIAMPV